MTLTSPLGHPQRLTPVSDPVLEIKNLSVDYGYDDDPVHVLRQVSLTLGRGEVLGLAGESGCGKSTLAYAATRLLPPPGLITGGEVLFTDRDGRKTDLLRLNDTQLRALALAGPRDRVPGRDELAEPGVPHRAADRRRHPGAPPRGLAEGGARALGRAARARRHLRPTGCGRTRTSSRAACASAS